jgi:DNA-directed RNA polymerase subunit H (RpoH/RPB5)
MFVKSSLRQKVIKIAKKAPELDVSKHVLVPKHIKLNDKEKKDLLTRYNIDLEDLPRISMSDPAVSNMELTSDDIIKIERPSLTAGIAHFYRRVVK